MFLNCCFFWVRPICFCLVESNNTNDACSLIKCWSLTRGHEWCMWSASVFDKLSVNFPIRREPNHEHEQC